MEKLISRMRAADREEGFTLVELIIAFIILALIVYAAFNLLDVNVTAGSVYALRADISQELRETTGAMVDQLRTASAFTNAQSDNVTFTSYLTGTNDLYNVQFFLDGNGNIIHRASTGELGEGDDKVLASNVTGLQINYYAGSALLDDPGGALDSISLVEIELTMTLSKSNKVMTDSMVTMVRVRR